jgi:hypothetical protein
MGVALIVGLAVALIGIIASSSIFTQGQKTFLILACILFLPVGVIATLVTYLSNKSETKE